MTHLLGAHANICYWKPTSFLVAPPPCALIPFSHHNLRQKSIFNHADWHPCRASSPKQKPTNHSWAWAAGSREDLQDRPGPHQPLWGPYMVTWLVPLSWGSRQGPVQTGVQSDRPSGGAYCRHVCFRVFKTTHAENWFTSLIWCRRWYNPTKTGQNLWMLSHLPDFVLWI